VDGAAGDAAAAAATGDGRATAGRMTWESLPHPPPRLAAPPIGPASAAVTLAAAGAAATDIAALRAAADAVADCGSPPTPAPTSLCNSHVVDQRLRGGVKEPRRRHRRRRRRRCGGGGGGRAKEAKCPSLDWLEGEEWWRHAHVQRVGDGRRGGEGTAVG